MWRRKPRMIRLLWGERAAQNALYPRRTDSQVTVRGYYKTNHGRKLGK